MRDYTIYRLMNGNYEADLYENGNWQDSFKGTEAEVLYRIRQYLDGSEEKYSLDRDTLRFPMS